MLSLVLLFIAAYLCGSIPFGKVIAQRYGVDIQRRGSGNIGFANVKRILGWKAGLLTLAGDILKGIIPTTLGLLYFTPLIAFLAGVAAILGHIFCLWLGFRGGKGVATGLGVATILSPLSAAIGASLYVICCHYKIKSSTASMLGAVTTAGIAVAIAPALWWQYALLLVIIAWTLRQNLWGVVPDYDA